MQSLNMSSPSAGQEMSFFEHLGDLRKRITWSLFGVIIGCIITSFFINDLMEVILLRPATNANVELQNLRPFGQAFLYFKVIFISGFILTFPWVLWNLWQFVAPGLYENERGWARKITLFTTFCFMLGVAFAYFVMIPSMMEFSASFGTQKIKNIIDVNEYFGFITTTILAAGLIFELPMITYVLARMGIVTSAMMRSYRRHSIVVILIIAAILTPSPDPINQIMFASPLYILYEISIIVAGIAAKSRNKQIE
jgi:sec-independent protein translocase protein TatC